MTVVAVSRSCSQQWEEWEPPSGGIAAVHKPLARGDLRGAHGGGGGVWLSAPFHRDEN